jgi:small-conductance mechanosensitive channel
LQLGDYVEIADKKGRVKDIGIRASRLLTTDGAEVVVPNGQLLSGQLTNWTLTNDHIRIELPVTISPTEKLPIAQEAILQTIQAHAQVMHKMPADILFTHVNDKECGLRVLCWISNIANEHKVKSELTLQLYQALKAAGVEVG